MWQVALLFFALLVQQAPAEYGKPIYIEDVVPEPLQSRIVSGWYARPGEHPHQTQLRMINPFGSVFGCGGSIVHREWVITAAHCTAVSVTIVVRAGVTHLDRPEYFFETQEWYNHPSFDDDRPSSVQANDIALLKLQRRLVYTAYTQPIRVQPSKDAFRDYDGLKVYASGFGRTWTLGPQPETLKWVYLTGVSNINCTNVFGTIITPTTVCARFYNVTSQSICQGDSGGPLVLEENGQKTLIGVSSFVAGGEFGCHSGLPGGFIRPGPFLDWFEEVSGIDFETLVEEEEPTTTTEEPTTTSTDEPTTTTEEPTTPTEDPTTTTEEPTTPTEEPTTTTEEPTTSTEEPTTSTEESTTTTEEPTITSTEEPSTTTETPDTTTITTEDPNNTTTTTITTEAPHNTTTTPKPESSTTTTVAPPITTTSRPEDDSSEEDPDLNDLLKRLEVKVKVKVKLAKYKRRS